MRSEAKTTNCYYFCLMNETQPSQPEGFRFKKLIQYFLQGLLVIGPIAITIYFLYWIVFTIDNQIPILTERGPDGKFYVRNYGLGFLLVIGAICLIGYLSSFFIKIRLFSLFDTWLRKAPGIRLIYTTVQDFFEAFAGEKKKFNRPVVANIDDNDIWRVGFITQDEMKDLGLPGYVAVYIPMAYSIAGNVYLVPRNRIRPLTNMNAADAMKFSISGGITTVADEKNISGSA